MSEFLASAAEKMGVPEPLVRRSAEARAKASGASTDDILSAWAGGEAAPAAAAPPPPEPETSAQPEAATETQPEPTPQTPAQAPAAQAPAPAPAGVGVAARPSAPPVLVGRRDRLAGSMLAALALAALGLLVGFGVGSTPEESNLAYTSELPYSDLAQEGRQVYLAAGCAGCHTQVVRPLVADAGLGGVTVSDTNQVIGIRRVGPDLARVGARVDSAADVSAVLDGAGGHPPFRGLAQPDLDALVAYLMESK
jgi:hypothetical protein